MKSLQLLLLCSLVVAIASAMLIEAATPKAVKDHVTGHTGPSRASDLHLSRTESVDANSNRTLLARESAASAAWSLDLDPDSSWTNETFANAVCNGMTSDTTSVTIASAGLNGMRLLLPDCFYLKASSVKYLYLMSMIIQGNSTHPNPLNRLAAAISQTPTNFKLLICYTVTETGATALVDWEGIRSITSSVNSFEITLTDLGMGSTIPTFPKFLPNLALDSCGLSGTLPARLFQTAPTGPIAYLATTLTGNGLTGTLPPTFLTGLELGPLVQIYFSLQNNIMNGTFPAALFEGHFATIRTVFVQLDNNSFTGPLHNIFEKSTFNPDTLTNFHLYYIPNHFEGEVGPLVYVRNPSPSAPVTVSPTYEAPTTTVPVIVIEPTYETPTTTAPVIVIEPTYETPITTVPIGPVTIEPTSAPWTIIPLSPPPETVIPMTPIAPPIATAPVIVIEPTYEAPITTVPVIVIEPTYETPTTTAPVIVIEPTYEAPITTVPVIVIEPFTIEPTSAPWTIIPLSPPPETVIPMTPTENCPPPAGMSLLPGSGFCVWNGNCIFSNGITCPFNNGIIFGTVCTQPNGATCIFGATCFFPTADPPSSPPQTTVPVTPPYNVVPITIVPPPYSEPATTPSYVLEPGYQLAPVMPPSETIYEPSTGVVIINPPHSAALGPALVNPNGESPNDASRAIVSLAALLFVFVAISLM